jgi:four helix bundle protein
MENKNVIKEKSFLFAIEIVALYKTLTDQKEFVLSKQLLRSGTSIGANVREAEHAQSKADFIHKLSISLKEANETEYWLDLLYETKYLSEL